MMPYQNIDVIGMKVLGGPPGGPIPGYTFRGMGADMWLEDENGNPLPAYVYVPDWRIAADQEIVTPTPAAGVDREVVKAVTGEYPPVDAVTLDAQRVVAQGAPQAVAQLSQQQRMFLILLYILAEVKKLREGQK